MNKIIIDDVAGKQIVPYLPLDQIIKAKPAEAPTQ